MAVTIRANDVKASNLYFLSSLVSSYFMFADRVPAFREGGPLMGLTIAVVLLTTLVLIAVGLGIRKGYAWVKILFLVLIALTSPEFMSGLPDVTNLRSQLTLGAYLLDVWAAIILLRDLLRQPGTGEAEQASLPRGSQNPPA